MTDSPAGKYLDNTFSEATGPVFSTVGQRGCRLETRLRLATQETTPKNGGDGIQTDVTGDGGANWSSEWQWLVRFNRRRLRQVYHGRATGSETHCPVSFCIRF